jgi:hypothetical protein
MGILTGIIGAIITFILLRRKGGAGRHIGVFVLGMAVSLILFGFWVASIVPPGGAYRSEWLAGVWAFGIIAGLVLQVLAMLIAIPVRRSASAKATSPST